MRLSPVASESDQFLIFMRSCFARTKANLDEEIEENLSTKSDDREVQVHVEAKWAGLDGLLPEFPPLVLPVPFRSTLIVQTSWFPERRF